MLNIGTDFFGEKTTWFLTGVFTFGFTFFGVVFFLGAAFLAGDFLGVALEVGVTATFLIALDCFEIGTYSGYFFGEFGFTADWTGEGLSYYFLKPKPPESRTRLVCFTLRKPRLLVPEVAWF